MHLERMDQARPELAVGPAQGLHRRPPSSPSTNHV
jgi:hypothetical protein